MIEKSIIDYTSLFEIGRKALTPSGTSTKLGPGCYNVPSTTLGGQAFQFGTTSRFKRLDVFTPA